MKVNKPVVCPYCHSRAILRPSSFVYGERALEGKQLYVCAQYPLCDAYVGVHGKTKRPQGMLANSELRNKRIRAHRAFDQIWKTGIMTKKEAYRWLQAKMGLSPYHTHIAKFSDYLCEEVIRLSQAVLENCNHVA